MSLFPMRYYPKGRAWKNEGSQKVQEVEIYLKKKDTYYYTTQRKKKTKQREENKKKKKYFFFR